MAETPLRALTNGRAGSNRLNSSHRRDGAVLAALLAGATAAEAGEQAGVSAATVKRRLADPGFRAELVAGRARLVDDAVGRLSAATGEAVEVLVELTDARYPPAIRLRAATAILEATLKLREKVEQEERLAALEERAGQGGQARFNGNGRY